MAVSAVWRLACLLAPIPIIPIGTKKHANAHRRCQRIGEANGSEGRAVPLS